MEIGGNVIILVIGAFLLCFGLISGIMYYKLGAGEFNNQRLLFTIGNMM